MGQDTATLEQFFNHFIGDWERNDANAIAEHFVDDGSIINPFGERADGRDAIAAMYSGYFDGMLKGTTTTFQVGSVRTVGEDHAFADGDQTICAPGGDVVLTAHLSTLLRRRGDSWLFVDARPYSFAPVPQ